MVRWQVNAAAQWLMRSLFLSPLAPWACEVQCVATHQCPHPEPIILMWFCRKEEVVHCPWVEFWLLKSKPKWTVILHILGTIRCAHERSIVYVLEVASSDLVLRHWDLSLGRFLLHTERKGECFGRHALSHLYRGGEESLACPDAPSNELCPSYSDKSIH